MCNLMKIIIKEAQGIPEENIERIKRLICGEVCNGICKSQYLVKTGGE